VSITNIDGSGVRVLKQRDYQALADFRFHIRRFLRFSEEAAHGEGLEPQQHQFLLVIQAVTEPASPTVGEVAERLLIHHHSAVGLADRLEHRGLVERIRDVADRRQIHLRLTQPGTDILMRLSALHHRELEQTGPELVAALQAVLGGVRQGDGNDR
jgi:DNA-binding MarR family transcriptional regulator